MSIASAEEKVKKSVEKITQQQVLDLANKEPTGLGVYIKSLFSYEYALEKEIKTTLDYISKRGVRLPNMEELQRKARILNGYTKDLTADSYLLLRDPDNRNSETFDRHKLATYEDLQKIDQMYQEIISLLPEGFREKTTEAQIKIFKKHFPQALATSALIILIVGSLSLFAMSSKSSTPSLVGYASFANLNSTFMAATAIGTIIMLLFAFIIYKKMKKK